MDSILLGCTSRAPLFTACPHIHTHQRYSIARRISGLCSKPVTVHAVSVYSLLCTDGFDALHLAAGAISGSFGATGLLQDS